MEARQGIEMPLSQGQMYEAKGSQMNIAMEVTPNMCRRLRLLPSASRWKVWKIDTMGKHCHQTISLASGSSERILYGPTVRKLTMDDNRSQQSDQTIAEEGCGEDGKDSRRGICLPAVKSRHKLAAGQTNGWQLERVSYSRSAPKTCTMAAPLPAEVDKIDEIACSLRPKWPGLMKCTTGPNHFACEGTNFSICSLRGRATDQVTPRT